jgi:hypothetical protein
MGLMAYFQGTSMTGSLPPLRRQHPVTVDDTRGN